MKRLRIYADTSVFGGCFDDEFSVESHRLLKRVIDGAIILVISDLVLIELDSALIRIRKILDIFPRILWSLLRFPVKQKDYANRT